MIKINFFLIVLCLLLQTGNTQGVGIGTVTPHPSAELDVNSNNKGLLIPRLTKSQRNNMSNVAGMLVYDIEDNIFYYNDGLQWRGVLNNGNGDAWVINGNANTNAAINSIGTTDKRPLRFIINNQRAGYIDTSGALSFGRGSLFNNPSNRVNTAFGDSVLFNNGTGATAAEAFGNTGIGSKALLRNTTGIYNTAAGADALYGNTTGTGNTAIGVWALRSNTTGASNVAVGIASLYNNVNGYSNIGVGWEALYSNNGGYQNIAIGAQSMRANTLGYDNVSLGQTSMYRNVLGHDNIALGKWSLGENTNGSYNIAIGKAAMGLATVNNKIIGIGDSALYNNGTTATETYHGEWNMAIGSRALYGNTIGFHNAAIGLEALLTNIFGSYNLAYGNNALRSNINGSNNIAFGYNALFGNTSGSQNIATGVQALGFNSTGTFNLAFGNSALERNTLGSGNVGIGYQALFFNGTGFRNTAIGIVAGKNNTGGEGNTFIGAFADANASNLTNATAIGYNAIVSNSNSLILGNNANVGIGTSSPSEKLQVVGTIKTDGFIMNTDAGLGKVLVSDATGLGTWNRLSKTEIVSIPAVAFQSLTNGDRSLFSITSEGEVAGTSSALMSAPLLLPNGATITGIFFNVIDSHDGSKLVGRLSAYPNGSPSVVQLATASTSILFAGGYTTVSASLSHVVNNATNSYAIVIESRLANEGSVIWGPKWVESVTITYSINLY